MRFKPYPGTREELDLLTVIAPVFRSDMESGEARLVGTGFWVTDAGHLVTPGMLSRKISARMAKIAARSLLFRCFQTERWPYGTSSSPTSILNSIWP